MIRVILIISLCIIATFGNAQNSPEKPKGFLSAGINPSYPFFGGYGVKAFYNFPSKWSVGIASEGNFELPEFAAEQFFKNGKNITVDWDYAIGIEARYRFRKKDNDIKGLYVAGAIGYEQWTIKKGEGQTVVPNTLQEDRFDNFFTNVGIGCNLFPFKKAGFWIGAQYDLIFILNNTDNRSINGVDYNIRPIVAPSFAPNLYIGWRFK